MDRFIRVDVSGTTSIESGQTTEVELEYSVSSHRTAFVSAGEGVSVTPKTIDVSETRSKQEATLKITGPKGFHTIQVTLLHTSKTVGIEIV